MKMLFRGVLELIRLYQESDNAGDIEELEVKREVFCNEKSVRQSEFYQAMATGLKPEIVFEIRFDEYNNEKKVRHGNITYDVIRTYSKNQEIIELTCGGGINATT